MRRARVEVNVLIEDRKLWESCDEGAAAKHARVEQATLARRDRKVPSLHLLWRQPQTIMDLNNDEVRQLMAAGFDVKIGDDAPYVMAIEKKLRHRYVAYAGGGWCISSAEKGDNLTDLAPSEHTIIPTLDLPLEAPMIIGIHDVFRTLKEDLRNHGIYVEFFRHFEKMFQILAVLVEDARKDLRKEGDSPAAQTKEVQLGKLSIAVGER